MAPDYGQRHRVVGEVGQGGEVVLATDDGFVFGQAQEPFDQPRLTDTTCSKIRLKLLTTSGTEFHDGTYKGRSAFFSFLGRWAHLRIVRA